jgi:hypothetical protein
VLTALVVGGIGWAAQPNAVNAGVIHACFNPSTGAIRVRTASTCPSSGASTPLDWNAKGRKGSPGTPGAPGPASLSALEGTACTAGTTAGILRVTTDASTGAVSMTCVTHATVSVSVSGGTLTRMTIDDQSGGGFADCRVAASCSLDVALGATLRVTLTSGDDLTAGSFFTYT